MRRTLCQYIPFILITLLVLVCYHQFFFIGGLPRGHDLSLEIVRLVEYKGALSAQWFPRMAQDLYAGAGSPIFVFYSPLFLLLSSILGFLLGAELGIKTVVFLVLLGSTYSLWHLARRYGGVMAGYFASAVYISTPYIFVDLFTRNAFAEFVGMMMIVPVLLALDLLFERDTLPRRAFLLVGWSALLVSHNITVMLSAPLILLLVMVYGYKKWRHEGWHSVMSIFWTTFSSFLIGATFIIPALLEKGHIDTAELLQGKFRAVNNVIPLWEMFASIGQIGWVTLPMMVLVLYGLWMVVEKKSHHQIMMLCSVLITMMTLLVSPIGKVVWQYVPFMQLLQFPWRLFILITPLTALLAGLVFASSGKILRSVLWAVVLVHMLMMYSVFVGVNEQSRENPNQITSEMVIQREMRTTVGDEYLPAPKYKKESPTIGMDQLEPSKDVGLFSELYRYCGDAFGRVIFPLHYFPYFHVYQDGEVLEIDRDRYYLTTKHIAQNRGCVSIHIGFTTWQWVGYFLGVLGLMVILGREFITFLEKRKNK